MKKVLLYSGGLDSFLISALWKPDIRIYVNIHGEYSEQEISRLPADVIVIDFPWLGTMEMPNKFVPLRNLYFLMIASHYGDEICLGATAGDWGNADKTPEFLYETEHLLCKLWGDKKTERHMKICKDFVRVSKSELIERYFQQGGNVETLRRETFSCYTPTPDGQPCFFCYPCFRKFALLMAHGAYFTYKEREKMWEYVSKQIIPTKEEGGYQGTYYTERGEESKDLIFCVEQLKKEFNK